VSRRWAPPGTGWIRTADYGDLATWMRPETHGLTVAVYSGDGFGHRTDGRAETWIVNVPPASWIPGEVMDKPHRIRWVLANHGDPHCGALRIIRRVVPPSHRGHRRLNRHRMVWRDPLPRRIRAALTTAPDAGTPAGLAHTIRAANRAQEANPRPNSPDTGDPR
jgi:hypothetical protein